MSESEAHPAWQLGCPVAIDSNTQRVLLAHGEGGRLTRQLIEQRLVTPLRNDILAALGDAANVPRPNSSLAITTDSFVVSPLFFPGGNIGSLSVFGTTNDLAVSGARPQYLTLSLVIEEGLPLPILEHVIESVRVAAEATSVQIVSGDTKVVPRGAADGLFINTTGVGELVDPVPPGPDTIAEGDELIITGPVGRHGIAVLCARDDLQITPAPESDSGSLITAASALRNRLGNRVRAMRDATRGGVTAVLHEWASACQLTLAIDEDQVPVSSDVRGACELLGIDPLCIANEGTMVVAVEASAVHDALAALQSVPETAMAARIGKVVGRKIAPVTVTRMLGRPQPLDEPQGAPLPRIC